MSVQMTQDTIMPKGIGSHSHHSSHICSSKFLLNAECKTIESMVTSNGYPLNLIKRKVKNTIDQFNTTKTPNLQNKIYFVPLLIMDMKLS